MHAFLDAHPRGRFGTIEYDLTQFALDPAAIATATRPYADHFAVQPE
jgi:hypothetical protein